MTVELDPFYPIVDSAVWVGRLAAADAKLIQLRIKNCGADDTRREIRQAIALCARYSAQLVVNDYWSIAIEEGADFIHLGQGDLEGADLRFLRAAQIRLGISTHDDAELDRALSIGPTYIALGPIYPTTLKVMPWSPQGLDRIGQWKQRIGARPLVAIGGITLERAPLCLAAGADCVAVVSDILNNADPIARAQAWITATRSPV
jgi:thiamine-phosphate pyrophosphorylase